MEIRVRPTIDKYLAITTTNLQNQLAYIWDFAWRASFMVLIMLIFVKLWSVTYQAQGVDQIAGLSLSDTIWYLVVTETVMLGKIQFARKVEQEIRDGSIAYTLGRPYNYLLYHLANGIGDALIRIVLTFVTGAILVWLMIGPPSVRLAHLPAILLIMAGAYLLDFCLQGIIALSAFFTEDITGFLLIYQKITFILGGMLLPIDFMPDWLQRIANLLPFQSITYAPGKLFVNFEWYSFWRLAGQQLFWIALGAAALALVFHWGTRRVSINGG